jgi:ATP/maltotriose-dependent transcriptional regulator MalT
VHPMVTFIVAVVQEPVEQEPVEQEHSPAVASAMAALARLAGHPDPWVAAQAELWLAHAAEFSGDTAGALIRFASARDKFAAIGDRWGLVSAVSSLGTGHGLTGDHTAAIAAFTEVEELSAALGAWDDAGRAQVWRGLERLRAGDLAAARDDLARARQAAQARRSAEITAFADIGLAEAARYAGDPAAAKTLLTGALACLDTRQGLVADISRIPALIGLGRVAVATGDLTGARAHLDASLKLATQFKLGPMIAAVAEACADAAVARADHGKAARLLGLAAAARGAADKGSPDVARTEAIARAALAERFDAEYDTAAALPAPAAVAALTSDAN